MPLTLEIQKTTAHKFKICNSGPKVQEERRSNCSINMIRQSARRKQVEQEDQD